MLRKRVRRSYTHLAVGRVERRGKRAWLAPLRTLSVLSYSMYLFHVLVHRAVNFRISYLSLDQMSDATVYKPAFIEYVGATILLAALTFRLVERPFLTLRGLLLPGRPRGGQRWNVSWLGACAVGAGAIAVAELLFL